MSALEIAGLLAGLYLLLLARSAWRQGELRQFGVALLVVAGLLGGLAAVVGLVILLDRGW